MFLSKSVLTSIDSSCTMMIKFTLTPMNTSTTALTGENDAVTGSAQYVTFGLPPHTCPGRFFAIQVSYHFIGGFIMPSSDVNG